MAQNNCIEFLKGMTDERIGTFFHKMQPNQLIVLSVCCPTSPPFGLELIDDTERIEWYLQNDELDVELYTRCCSVLGFQPLC